MDKLIIGIDVGGTNIKGGIFSSEYELLAEERIAAGNTQGWQHVMGNVQMLIERLVKKANVSRNKILCIGLGIPGLMDREKGISVFSPNFSNWENVMVVKWIEERLGIPAFMDNDVRMNLYGEWQFGAGIGKKNLVLITLGTGLGSGVVMDGNVIYGVTDSAGEIGHMNIFREGRPCRCGSSGCLGRYVSALGMVRTFLDRIEAGEESIVTEWVEGDMSKVTAEMISRAYDKRDSSAVKTLEETGTTLGYGLVNAVNLYNPEMVIVGGGMAAAGERLLKTTRAVVASRALEIARKNCIITTAALKDSAGIYGAAYYANKMYAEK